MLNVKPRDVEAIQNKYQDPKDRLYHIILAFLGQAEPRPTWRVIVDALRSPVVNLTALARRVEAAHCPDLTATLPPPPATGEPVTRQSSVAIVTGPSSPPKFELVVTIVTEIVTGPSSPDCIQPQKEIKLRIRSKTGIPAEHQRLMHGGRQLEDDNCLGDYNIGPDSTVSSNLRLRGGSGPVRCFIDPSLLDEKFNYDFTSVRDDRKKYYRGGERYYPPYGSGSVTASMYWGSTMTMLGSARTEIAPR